MEDIIRQVVQKQIRTILDNNREVISNMVKENILPELYKMVQDEIHREFLSIAEKQPPLPDLDIKNKEVPDQEPQKGKLHTITQDNSSKQGKYLYCIVKGNEESAFALSGIDGHKVYTLCHKELSAVIHDCNAIPYQSDDEKVVTQWIMTHQQVVENAWEIYGVAVPASFDTIIAGNKEFSGEENLKKWLETHYQDLMAKMEKFTGRAEYGVQIFWDANQMGERITQENEEIRKINEECKEKSKGAAYMYRKKLESLLKKELENKAEYYFKEFYNKIKEHVEDIKIDKTKNNSSGRQMIMNLACIMPRANSHLLGETLEAIDRTEPFSVRYTGPWPPYNFV